MVEVIFLIPTPSQTPGDGGSPGSVLSVPEFDHLEVHRVIVFVYACVCVCMCGEEGGNQ